jgi:hypothetical protein
LGKASHRQPVESKYNSAFSMSTSRGRRLRIEFARRDLVPAIAHLPLAQWQCFRDWQAGLRRNDPTTEGQVYAIKRGFQIARQMLPEANTVPDRHEPSPLATGAPLRAVLVEEIDAARKLTGKSPDDGIPIGNRSTYSHPTRSTSSKVSPLTFRKVSTGADCMPRITVGNRLKL